MSSTNSTNLVFDICKFLNPAVDVSKPFYVNYAIAFSQFYTPIHKVLVGIIVAFGLISNGSLLAVLTRKKMSSATNKFLIGISIADSVVLITYSCIWIQFVQRKFFSYELSYAFATYIGPYLMYRGVSSLLTVLLALWRVSSLYFPFQSSIKLTDGNAVKGMLFCFGICQILFIPHTIGFKNISANCTINGMYQTVFYVSYWSCPWFINCFCHSSDQLQEWSAPKSGLGHLIILDTTDSLHPSCHGDGGNIDQITNGQETESGIEEQFYWWRK